MIIAIDYDGTYAAAPELWDQVIKLFQEAKHTVICVTGRSDEGVMGTPVKESIGKLCPVIFAGGVWKNVAAENRGYKVNVWIDDMPSMIYRPDKGF
jgi:hypothetical protein